MGKYVETLEMLQVALKLVENSRLDAQLQSAKINAVMSAVLLSQKAIETCISKVRKRPWRYKELFLLKTTL